MVPLLSIFPLDISWVSGRGFDRFLDFRKASQLNRSLLVCESNNIELPNPAPIKSGGVSIVFGVSSFPTAFEATSWCVCVSLRLSGLFRVGLKGKPKSMLGVPLLSHLHI